MYRLRGERSEYELRGLCKGVDGSPCGRVVVYTDDGLCQSCADDAYGTPVDWGDPRGVSVEAVKDGARELACTAVFAVVMTSAVFLGLLAFLSLGTLLVEGL